MESCARSVDEASPVKPRSRQNADADFTALSLSFNYQRPAALGTNLNLFANGRYDFNEPALRSQQFAATGQTGLSGLLPGSILGDYGFSSRAELGRPISIGAMNTVVTPYAYVAAAETHLRAATAVELSRTTAEGAGLGLTLDFLTPVTQKGSWQGRLEWSDTQSNDQRFDRSRIGASLAYRF